VQLERAEHNVVDVSSNSYSLAVSKPCDLVAWLEWGASFAQRHNLRLQVFIAPGMVVPKAFRDRAVVLERAHLRRLCDDRTLAYRALKIAVHPADTEVLQQGYSAMRDACFDLEARSMEPTLRDLAPEQASRLRAAMRAAWDLLRA
jgi:hypothetical protein